MAWYSWFLGTPEVVQKVTDTAANVVNTGVKMLDNAFYTDQEKADCNLKMMSVWMDLQKLLANDSGVSAIARRAVAFLIMLTFCLLVVLSAVVFPLNWPTAELGAKWSAHILKVIEDSSLGYLAMTVGVFFFGLYAFGKYTKWGTTSVIPENKEQNQEQAKP